jgi:hypothetical protein
MPATQSRAPGCFWVFCLLMGLISTAVVGAFVIVPVARARCFYEETTCTILDKRIAHDNDGNFRPEFLIEYRVAGQVHQVWTYEATRAYTNIGSPQALLDQFVVDKRYPCWYDPAAPEKSVLVRGFAWWHLLTLIPVVFVVIGAGGLIANRRARRRGKAAAVPVEVRWDVVRVAGPRLAAMGCALAGGFVVAGAMAFAIVNALFARNAPVWAVALGFCAPFALFFVFASFVGRRFSGRLARALPSPERANAAKAGKFSTPQQDDEAVAPEPAPDDLPTVPRLDPAGPGHVLTAALAREPTGAVVLGCLVPFAALWIGIISFPIRAVWEGHRQGRPDWAQTVFFIPFVLIALGLIVAILVLAARGLLSLLVGRVRVEVSAYPLRAGGRYTVCVRKLGGASLSDVSLALVCRESATRTTAAGSTTTQQAFSQRQRRRRPAHGGGGSNTSTREVLRIEADPPGGDPFDGLRTVLTVPASAMHSFASAHNKVDWLIEVRGRALGLLPWRGRFPVLVHPAED